MASIFIFIVKAILRRLDMSDRDEGYPMVDQTHEDNDISDKHLKEVAKKVIATPDKNVQTAYEARDRQTKTQEPTKNAFEEQLKAIDAALGYDPNFEAHPTPQQTNDLLKMRLQLLAETMPKHYGEIE
jgi:hypothetical protein